MVALAAATTTAILLRRSLRPDRRLPLAALERAERLTEEFAANPRSWRHSGFSVYSDDADGRPIEGASAVGRVGHGEKSG